MGDDIWGYKSLSIVISNRQKAEQNIELISYQYSENDGYQFINRGSERKIKINISSMVTVDLLKFIIDKLNPAKGLKNCLQKMVCDNTIKSGEYWDCDDE